MVATLTIKRGPLKSEFTTRNLLEPDKRVLMQFVSGPFRVLEGLWTLTPLGDLGCRVELEMRFEFANRAGRRAVRAAVRGHRRVAGRRVRQARPRQPRLTS